MVETRSVLLMGCVETVGSSYANSFLKNRIKSAVLASGGSSGIVSQMGDIDCLAVLKALGEPTRMRIMRLLLKQPLGVNAISEQLGVSQYNTSKHLRILREAGLLETKSEGRLRLYGVAADLAGRLAANKNVLELDCCTFRFDKLPE